MGKPVEISGMCIKNWKWKGKFTWNTPISRFKHSQAETIKYKQNQEKTNRVN